MGRQSFQDQYNQAVSELQERLRSENLGTLASATRVSRQTLWRIRQGRITPSPEMIDTIWAGIETLEQAESGES